MHDVMGKAVAIYTTVDGSWERWKVVANPVGSLTRVLLAAIMI